MRTTAPIKFSGGPAARRAGCNVQELQAGGGGRARTPAAATALQSAVQLASAPSLHGVVEAAERAGGFFAPPLVAQPDAQLLQRRVPFLTKAAGALPVKPTSLDHALYLYGSYSSHFVSVRVHNEHVRLQSWQHAVEVLQQAEAERSPYWCSLLEDVVHPAWWPREGHVPNYSQVIFGRGSASIGLHFDKDNKCAGGSRVPVATYLAICEGAKACLLLPPDQTLLPPGGDESLLLEPSPQLLEDVRAAGGYFFLLADEPSIGGDGGGSGDFSATALYMPDGWWHWLVGLSEWHVVYGGSCYPAHV